MNTFQIQSIHSIANSLSFARAAEQMSVSQPAITHQIQTLENELNTKLFRRSTRLVELTLDGQAFISYMRSSGKQYQDPAATIHSWYTQDHPAPVRRSYECKEHESL